MPLPAEVNAAQTLANQIERLFKKYQAQKASLEAELKTLDEQLEANRRALEIQSGLVTKKQTALDEKEDALGRLKEEKEASQAILDEELALQTKANGDLELYTQAKKQLLEAQSRMGKKSDTGDECTYTYSAWYLPETQALSWEFDSILPHMNWTKEYKESWKTLIKESRDHHKSNTRWLRNMGSGKKEESPHYQLKTLVDARIVEVDKKIKALEDSQEPLETSIQEKKEALAELEKCERTAQGVRDEVFSDCEAQRNTVQSLDDLIAKQEKEKAAKEASIAILSYQSTLLPLQEHLQSYPDLLESVQDVLNLEDIEAVRDTEDKKLRAEKAISELNKIDNAYTEETLGFLKEACEKVRTPFFDPVRAEEKVSTVFDEIKQHQTISKEIKITITTLVDKKRALDEKAMREAKDRQAYREYHVNRLLDKDEREGSEGSDFLQQGLLSGYLSARGNVYRWLDWCQDFLKALIGCCTKYETEKEKRERLINQDIKPALKAYRQDGDKDKLMQVINPIRQQVTSRTQKGRTGYHFTFHQRLDLIEALPSQTDIVKLEVKGGSQATLK